MVWSKFVRTYARKLSTIFIQLTFLKAQKDIAGNLNVKGKTLVFIRGFKL